MTVPATLLAVAVPIPVKPVLTHGAITGTFDIVNYDASLDYTLTPSSGSASRTGATITLTAANAACTVTASQPGGLASPVASCERMAYTTNMDTVTVSYIHAPPEHGNTNHFGAPGTLWLRCNKFPWDECGHQEGVNVKNPTPSGFTDSYGEWWRVS